MKTKIIKAITRTLNLGLNDCCDVEINIEPPDPDDPDQKSHRMHFADTNYGVIWYPTKRHLQKLHKILGDYIAKMED